MCDSCHGPIGGPRLFCIDCVIKDAEGYDTVDLCCARRCVGVRITNREDLEGVHEPNHRLVKARTPVLTRSHGRTYIKACEAFEHVRAVCMTIADLSSHPRETAPNERKTSSSEQTPRETLGKGDDLDNSNASLDCTKGGAETVNKTTPDAIPGRLGVPDQDLPTCGKCNGRLSFPFWYCIFCEGQSIMKIMSPLPAC